MNADPNAWESLRLGFVQLRSDCAINPPLNPVGRLTAIWTSMAVPNWRLNYSGDKDGAGVKERFGWHALEAAALLGHVGEGSTAVSFWLDQLRESAPKQYLKRIVMTGGPGHEDQLYSIEILDVCGLSAEFCRKCKADAIRAEGKRDHTASQRGTNSEENSEAHIWGALAKEFRSLDCRCFSLEWDEPEGFSGVPPRLFLKRTDDDACLSSRMAFEALAAEAGLRIDPNSTDPIGLWLAKLIREMPNASLGTTTHTREDLVREWVTRCIPNPCLSSDALCSSLQRQARIAEQGKTREKQEGNGNTPGPAAFPPLPSPFQEHFEAARTKCELDDATDRNHSHPGGLVPLTNTARPAGTPEAVCGKPAEVSKNKRGPKRDYETALKVASIVDEAAPDRKFRAHLERICDALDNAKIRRPKTWKKKGYETWFDCLLGDCDRVIKAIEHHRKRAAEHGETFS